MAAGVGIKEVVAGSDALSLSPQGIGFVAGEACVHYR